MVSPTQTMTELCEQVDPRVLRALRDLAVDERARRMRPFPDMLRLQESWVAAGRSAFCWLAARVPDGINPDHLTVLG
jgi:hypothetical protein